MSQPPIPRRALGGFDATTVGVGSIIGAGAFVVFAPASAAAGVLLPLAVVIAGFVAYCNAAAMALLAEGHTSGDSPSAHVREQLGPWAGFLAGWGLVTGQLASAAAMALTFGLYAAPGSERVAAIAAVVALTIVNLLGITRTTLAARVIVALVVPVLAFVIVVGLASPAAVGSPAVMGATPTGVPAAVGTLQGAALVFFAFAGYSRIATMGRRIREPRRNIPAVLLGALGFTLVLYVLLSFSLLRTLGPAGLAGTTAPLRELVTGAATAGSDDVLGSVVTGAAVLAVLGALLAQIARVGRTARAMAQDGDVPKMLSRVSTRYAVPWVAEVTAAAAVVVLLLTTDLVTVIGVACFGLLVSSAIINGAAFMLTERRWFAPRWLNVVGAAGCLALAVALPGPSVLITLAVLAAGVIVRGLTQRRRRTIR